MNLEPTVAAGEAAPAREMKRIRRNVSWIAFALGVIIIATLFVYSPFRGPDELLNVSYDGSREYFREIDETFSRRDQEATVKSFHAASGKQAFNIIQGLKADVVTLATAADVDAIQERTGRVGPNWQKRFPYGSSPFTSTIVFLVRSGNPKSIDDWSDLVRREVHVIAPSPKISGAGRWAFLSAWAYSLQKNPGDELMAARFVGSIYAKNPVLNEGARGALIAFLDQARGDVLLTWESEALNALESYGDGEVQIVYPSLSIKAEPVVAVMERTANERGTSEKANAYLEFLFSPVGQEVAARHYLRPRDLGVGARFAEQFPEIETFTLDEVFGSWAEAQMKHFSPGGTFDRIYKFENMKRNSY